MATNAHARLAALRPDVELLDGPRDPDGAPTLLLHDPVTGLFRKASWAQGAIIKRLRAAVTLGGLRARIERETTLRPRDETLLGLHQDLQQNGLLSDPPGQAHVDQSTGLLDGWLGVFRRLVFWRMPLVRPDDFLTRTAPAVAWLARGPLLALYLCIGLVGLIFASLRAESYFAMAPGFLTLAGMGAFALALVLVKTGHELAHAYTAHRLGCRVRSIGIAFILLMPVAYSDVTDSWRLSDRKRRMLISLAGVLFELTIAGVALFVWALSPPGALRDLAFVFSSLTLVTTLLVNLNPAMRYDGYYVLADLLAIDNLQARAANTWRWLLRTRLFGLALPQPEARLSARRRRVLATYAVGAWAYRLVLYVLIAWLMYHWVAKVIGVVLCATAITAFVVRPVCQEVRVLWRLRDRFRPSRWNVAGWLLILGVVAWLALPLPRWISLPAVVEPRDQRSLHAPHAGKVTQVFVKRGETVAAGQVLFEIVPPGLADRERLAELAAAACEIELAIARQEGSDRTLLPHLESKLRRAAAERAALQQRRERGRVRAWAAGRLVEQPTDVTPGAFVATNTRLGRLVSGEALTGRAYVPSHLVDKLDRDASARFQSANGEDAFDVAIHALLPSAATTVRPADLSSLAGGPIAVQVDEHGRFVPREAWHELMLALPASDGLRAGQTGSVWLWTTPRSYIGEWVQHAWSVILSETSF